MKKSSKITLIIFLLVIIIAVGGYFGVKYFLDKDLEKAKQELQETIEKYGYVEKESIETLVAKFNTEIKNNGMKYPASEEYLAVENDMYWYGMYEDISCYIVPEKFSNNKKQDIAEVMAIHFPKDSKNEKMAIKYAKSLIKANNSKLTDEDIDYLLSEAKKLSADKQAANNGKGISVSLAEADDHYEYQVIRVYQLSADEIIEK